MGRHELREQIFKLLFRVEFNSIEEMPEQVRLFFDDDETEFSKKDIDYIQGKYEKIQEKIPEIDKIINDNTEHWNTARMGKVELTILRLAVYEALFDDDIPVGVAIDEAVELAKVYGQDNAGGFVNAILSKIVKQGD
jgi:N utilization substance protein B